MKGIAVEFRRSFNNISHFPSAPTSVTNDFSSFFTPDSRKIYFCLRNYKANEKEYVSRTYEIQNSSQHIMNPFCIFMAFTMKNWWNYNQRKTAERLRDSENAFIYVPHK